MKQFVAFYQEILNYMDEDNYERSKFGITNTIIRPSKEELIKALIDLISDQSIEKNYRKNFIDFDIIAIVQIENEWSLDTTFDLTKHPLYLQKLEDFNKRKAEEERIKEEEEARNNPPKQWVQLSQQEILMLEELKRLNGTI